MRRNRYAGTPDLPAVLGAEAAGVVEAVGEDAHGPGAGMRVVAPLFAAGSYLGGYADHVVIDRPFVCGFPTRCRSHATALMIQGLTALHLTRQAPPRGKAVLVSAAAGGVGSLLVQLARRAGAKTVIAAASTAAERQLSRSLGEDETVDYTRPDWPERVRDVTDGHGPDIVYESVGGAVTTSSLGVLAPLGQLVVYGALNIQDFQLGIPELLGLIFKNQSLTGFALAPLLTMENLNAGLSELFALALDGQLDVTSGGSYPLARAGDAHRAIEGRESIGKIVLDAA